MVKRLTIGLIKFAIYVAFVASAIYFTPKILAKAMHTEYPLATITSGSMWPALKVNDLILMKGVSGSEVEIGQIIVYQNASQGFTIHRLVRKENGMLVTKGDANEAEDSPNCFYRHMAVSPSLPRNYCRQVGAKNSRT